MDGVCHRCWGLKFVVVGLLFVVNYYWLKLDWWLLVGVLLVLKGVACMVMPHCPCGVPCASCQAGSKAPAKPAKKK